MNPLPQLHPSTPPPQNKGKDRAALLNEQQQQAPSKNSVLDTQMEKFDFDDFRARFDAVMQTHMARDKELVDEYKRVVQVSRCLAIYLAFCSFVLDTKMNLSITRRTKHG